jgi:hypothetical protein
VAFLVLKFSVPFSNFRDKKYGESVSVVDAFKAAQMETLEHLARFLKSAV